MVFGFFKKILLSKTAKETTLEFGKNVGRVAAKGFSEKTLSTAGTLLKTSKDSGTKMLAGAILGASKKSGKRS